METLIVNMEVSIPKDMKTSTMIKKIIAMFANADIDAKFDVVNRVLIVCAEKELK